ncbi:MAG: LPS export ABC transporter periplasmic protein LptC [Rhodocyclaceae bacterium]|nr:LPS export ABC transporter periplasmic protein LptC [Rhodocyclaceae bacterium]
MSVRSFNWLPVILLIALAALSFWLDRVVQEKSVKPQTPNTGVDFWADSFTVKSFGPDGKLKSTLSASRLTHESSDDSSTLLTPKINTARAPSMTITADRALASSGAESVEFIGNVKLDRTAAGGKNAGKGPLRVRTERMLVHPDIELAEGRAAVRIEQNGSVVNAGSYRIDGRTGVSVLEGRVRATLPPSKP